MWPGNGFVSLWSSGAIWWHRSDQHWTRQWLVAWLTLIAKFMGPTWVPPGSCRPQIGPMLARWTLLSGDSSNLSHYLKQCWLIISNAPWYSSEGMRKWDTNQTNKIEIYILLNCIQISQGPMSLNKCSIERVKPVLQYYDSKDPLLTFDKISVGPLLDWYLTDINPRALMSRYVLVIIGSWPRNWYIHEVLSEHYYQCISSTV